MILMVKIHCSVLGESSVKAAIEDYKKKQAAKSAETELAAAA
jgi:nitrogen fixation protein NifU and related proteins